MNEVSRKRQVNGMPTPAFSVSSPDRSRHADGLIELCSRTFPPYYDLREMCRGWYLLHGHYDWEASAIGLLGDEVVTHWGVWRYRMRIGGAAVQCGGIGAVSTSAEHRRRGLMARTAPRSVERMRALGYDVSVLFGIEDFYHRFGYVPAWEEEIWHVQRDALPRELPRIRYRAHHSHPDRETARLHNRTNAGLTGTAVRPTYTRALGGPYKTDAYGWRDASGRLAGHVCVREQDGALACTEATGEADAILAVLRRLSVERELKQLRFVTLPHRSALAARLRRLTSRLERRYERNGGAMVRVMNLEGCLRKMVNELSTRLAASELRDFRGSLSIGGDGAVVRLALRNGEVDVAPPGPSPSSVRLGARVAQLLIGSGEPLEVCEAAGARLRGDAARLLRVLFPAQHPQLHVADRF